MEGGNERAKHNGHSCELMDSLFDSLYKHKEDMRKCGPK